LNDERSPEEIAKELEARHRNYSLLDDEMDEESSKSDIRQQSNLPSVRDPKLWMVKCKVIYSCVVVCLLVCKNGKERATVVALMRKFLEKEPTEDKLLIKSAIAPDHLKGYIYIEAEKESHVKSVSSCLLRRCNLFK
jgi:transcription elongation factor SPT5